MLKKIVHNITQSKLHWRKVKFNELTEIYTSMTLRQFGFGLIGIFVPVYLYQNGVGLQSIFYFLAMFFLFRVPSALIASLVTARIGPKHTLALSNIALVLYLLILLSYRTIHWPLLLLAIFYTFALALFFIAYGTDFSKIQHAKHGGKELGLLYIFERIGGALGPLVGGLVASFISAEATIILAVIVLLGSLVPLFMSKEPVRIKQKIKLSGFDPRNYTKNFISLSAMNISNISSLVMWPLLAAVFIFNDEVYAKIGFMVALGTMISIVSAYKYGKLIDNGKGGKLLNFGVVLSVIVNIFRAFTGAPVAAIVLSSVGEPINLSQRMPIIKGYYNEASSVEGYRIVYFMWGEIYAAVIKFYFMLSLFAAAFYFDSTSVLRGSFVVVAVLTLFTLVQRFPALKKV